MFKLISYTFLTVLTVNLLATSEDISITWSSPMSIKLQSNDSSVNPIGRPITDVEESYVESLINIGAMIGPFPFSLISEKFGRKIGLLTIAIPLVISYLTLAFSKTIYLFYFARVMGGLAVGGAYTLLPMYMAEVAEDSMRGIFSVSLNIFWAVGNLISYSLGPYIPIMWFNIILACFPAIFFCIFFFTGLETPYYLVQNDKINEAEDCLMKLRATTRPMVKEEIEHIQQVLAHNEESKFFDLFRDKTYLKALGISLVLIIGAQLSGIDAILFNTQEIFSSAGSATISDDISSIIVGFTLLFSSFISPFVVDRWGRRILLLISLTGNIISLVILGVFFYMQSKDINSVADIGFLPVLSLVMFIFSFNIGLGPLPWTISSELFPANVKSAAASINTAASWSTSFLVTRFFKEIQLGVGEDKTYWMFAGFCAVEAVFVYFFVPETKGKSFADIQEILNNEESEQKQKF